MLLEPSTFDPPADSPVEEVSYGETYPDALPPFESLPPDERLLDCPDWALPYWEFSYVVAESFVAPESYSSFDPDVPEFVFAPLPVLVLVLEDPLDEPFELPFV